MGVTAEYEIPYPEDTDFVKDGASAMQSLAETVETDGLIVLDSPAYLILTGNSTEADADSRIAWNTGAPLADSGSWTFPNNNLIVPPKPGVYLVAVDFKLKPFGGASDHLYNFTARIQTKVSSADQSTAVTWFHVAPQTIDAGSSDTAGPRIGLTGLVVVDSTAGMGIQVQITVPETVSNKTDADTSGRLHIVYQGRV